MSSSVKRTCGRAVPGQGMGCVSRHPISLSRCHPSMLFRAAAGYVTHVQMPKYGSQSRKSPDSPFCPLGSSPEAGGCAAAQLQFQQHVEAEDRDCLVLV